MRPLAGLWILLWAAGSAGGDAAAHLQEIKGLDPERDNPQVASQMERLLDAALREHPDSYELWVEDCLLQVWIGDSATHRGVKRQLARQARRSADRALGLRPEGSEAHYCAAIGVGQYALAVGVVAAMKEGLLGSFNRHIDFAVAHEPGLRWGNPLLVKGRYYSEVPWPLRDLKATQLLYSRVMAEHPENLRVYLFQAETLLRQGRPKAALETLSRALEGPVDYDPPDGRRVQALARMLKQEIERKLQ